MKTLTTHPLSNVVDPLDLNKSWNKNGLKIENANEFKMKGILSKKLIEIEKLAWNAGSEDLLASEEKIQKRVEVFPEGVSIATLKKGREIVPVGSQFCFLFDWDGDLNKLTSWDHLTNHGNIDVVHNVAGNTGFLVGVGVVPEFRNQRSTHNLRFIGEYKASELLIAFTLDSLFDKGVKQVIANARIPFYHLMPGWGTPMCVDEYCKLREANGKLFDPVLRFHERMGAKVIKPVAYSMDDPESLNGGAWVLYERRFEGY